MTKVTLATLPLFEEAISKILPHRDPFVFVDAVLEVEPGKRILASKTLRESESFFKGHFPGYPVMPGVLQIEALAQALGILAYFSDSFDPEKQIAYLAGVDEVKFRRIVVPGETLVLDVALAGMKRGICKARGIARVGAEVSCEATIVAAVKALQG